MARKKKKRAASECSQKREPPPDDHPKTNAAINTAHMQRDHRCCTMPSGDGKCDYQVNGKSTTLGDYEVHHIVCHSSANSYTAYAKNDKAARAIGAWLTITDWCINRKKNLVPLPLRSEYEKVSQAGDIKSAHKSLWDLVCHNWDHNCNFGYTHEVTTELQDIWDSLKTPRSEEKCPKPSKVQKAFQSTADNYRSLLEERGTRNDGTKDVLEKIIKKVQLADKWWRPFSMASTAVADLRKVSKFGIRPKWVKGYRDLLKNKFTPGAV